MRRLFSTLCLLALLGLVGCEEPTPAPTNPNDSEQEQNPSDNPGENPEPEPEPEPEPLPEATYELTENIHAGIITLETNGLRNDYLSFYDNQTQYSLFIDFYNEPGNDHLLSGVYPIGDGSAGTCAQEYTYFSLYINSDLWRFDDGKATVTADTEHESGFTWYTISAYFTMPSGETVSLWYEGQPTTM